MVQSYEIWVQGELDPDWADWFDNLNLTHRAEGVTVLTGPLVDQAALYGVLNKIHNLGLVLVAVNPVEKGQK